MLPAVGCDDINSIGTDAFTGTQTQRATLGDGGRISFPSKMGRLVVPFAITCSHTLTDLMLAASLWSVGDSETEFTIIPERALLAEHRVCDEHAGVSIVITSSGVQGHVIMRDGGIRHYYTCSQAWRLLVGSFDTYAEAPSAALTVCVCFSIILAGCSPIAAALEEPDTHELSLAQLEDVYVTQHTWVGSDILSVIPVSGPLALPSTFNTDIEMSSVVAEGWLGAQPQGWLSLEAWLERYCIVRDDEIARWRDWMRHRTRAIAERLSGCCVSVCVGEELPSGQSTSRIVTRHLGLAALADGINNLQCGLTAAFESSLSRGCKITFPSSFAMPPLILTSNGSFDSSPFPRTAAMQAQLLSLIVTAIMPASRLCAPGRPSAIADEKRCSL